MAEEETKDQQQDDDDARTGGKGLNRMVLLLGVMVLGAGAGFGAACMMGAPEETLAEELAAEEPPPAPKGREGNYEYVDFKEVTVNLDTEKLARYLRVTLLLAIEDTKGKEEVKETIKKHLPELESRLRVYLAGKSLDDVRGKENQNKIIGEIYDNFNQYLWPNAKPMISHVLFKDFILQ